MPCKPDTSAPMLFLQMPKLKDGSEPSGVRMGVELSSPASSWAPLSVGGLRAQNKQPQSCSRASSLHASTWCRRQSPRLPGRCQEALGALGEQSMEGSGVTETDVMNTSRGNGSSRSHASQCVGASVLTTGDRLHISRSLPTNKLVLSCLLAGTPPSPQKQVMS